MASPIKSQLLRAVVTYKILKARALSIESGVKFDTTLINALAKASAISVISKTTMLTSALQAQLLAAAALPGMFLTILRPRDLVDIQEDLSLALSKLRVDEVRAITQALLNTNKLLADLLATDDTAHLSTTKRRVDYVGISDGLLTTEFNALRTDSAATQEHKRFELRKGFAQLQHASDTYVTEVGKNKNDLATLGDEFTRTVIYVRHLTDTATVTDDFFGAANLDDDQVVEFIKTLDDLITHAVDDITHSISRVSYENASAKDNNKLFTSKQQTDTINSDENHAYSFSKPIEDGVSPQDTRTSELSKPLETSAAASDYIGAIDLQKLFNDAVVTHDGVTVGTAKIIADLFSSSDDAQVVRIKASGIPQQLESSTTADIALLGLRKNFLENQQTTDDFYGVANADDDQLFLYGKNFVEPLSALEVRSYRLQRGLSEAVTAGDTGYIFWTDYCDSTYFTQSYVGNERIFT